MAYDGMYSDLSTRGATNEVLNLAIQTKDEIVAASVATALNAAAADMYADASAASAADATSAGSISGAVSGAAAGQAAAEAVIGDKVDVVDVEEMTVRDMAVDYTPGILITSNTQTVRNGDVLYQVFSTAIPFTTTNWITDSSKFFQAGDSKLREELLSASGTDKVGFDLTPGVSVPQTASRKLREVATIKDYGAIGDGTLHLLSEFYGTLGEAQVKYPLTVTLTESIDTAAAVLMATQLGYIDVPRGGFYLTAATFSVPINFQPGGYFDTSMGTIININNRIESSRQYILRGIGSYVLGNGVSGTGEDARQIHVSWFGAFPSSLMGVDQAPAIQVACTAMGNGRESVIQFDIGNYVMRSAVVTTRGCWIRGEGQRRTVFKTDIDGFDFFTTGNTACRFSNIQFELDLTAISTRDSAAIVLNHDGCDIYDVFAGQSKFGIVCNALRYRVRNVIGAYGSTPSAGSSLVACNAGQGHVADIYCLTSAFGPSSIVNIGSGAAGTISDVFVDNVDSVTPSKLVFLDAVNGNIFRCQLNNLRYGGSSGTIPNELLHFRTSNTRSLDSVTVDGLTASNFIPNIITIEQNSSGETSDISIDSVVVKGASTGYGIGFIRTTGSLQDCSIGPNVNFAGRATPFFYSGNPVRINISPASLPDATSAVCYDMTVADDSVAVINLRRQVFTGFVLFSAATINGGVFVIRAATTPGFTTMQATANVAIQTGVLTGTTGVDGKITIGIDNGVLYVENRLGSSQRCSLNLLTGIL